MDKGKHVFGVARLGDKGQIVIPKRAREIFHLKPGDELLILGDEERGLALVRTDDLQEFASQVLSAIHTGGEKDA